MSQEYIKCNFSGKIVWFRAFNSKFVEYYYDNDVTKHLYKVQISFFKKNAKLVK